MIRTTGIGRLGALLLLAAPIVYLIGETVAALAWSDPPYNYVDDYVSSLTVVLASVMVLFGIGGILLGLFPGSQHSVDTGLIVYHMLGAQLAIISGNTLAILVGAFRRHLNLSRPVAVLTIVLGTVGLVFLAAFLIDVRAGINVMIGLVERGPSIPSWQPNSSSAPAYSPGSPTDSGTAQARIRRLTADNTWFEEDPAILISQDVAESERIARLP
jgi:hypothetical protein